MTAPPSSGWRAKARQILTTWLAAWPTLTLVLFVLRPVTGHWPLPLRALASATAMASAMNLVSLPLARRALAWWLDGPGPARLRRFAGPAPL